jgi:hypothetical protein
MRAVLCDRFEGISVLRVGDTAEPIPADDEILIDVHAASERRPGHCCGRIGCQGAACATAASK